MDIGISFTEALVGLVAVAAADTIIGIGKAIIGGNFSLDHVAQFVRSHLLERVLPIAGLLIVAQLYPSLGQLLGATALAAAAAYVAETLGSIRDTLGSGG